MQEAIVSLNTCLIKKAQITTAEVNVAFPKHGKVKERGLYILVSRLITPKYSSK